MADEVKRKFDLSKAYFSGDPVKDKKLEEALKEVDEVELAKLIDEAVGSEVAKLQTFTDLARDLGKKQEELDVMAMDSLPSAVLTSYLSDILDPNNDGQLVSIVAQETGNQTMLDLLYEDMSIPLDKAAYSLLKNGIIIGKFEREKVDTKEKAANEGISKQKAEEQIFVQKNVGKLIPEISLIQNSYTVFPILKNEHCIGYIEVTRPEALTDYNWESDSLDFQDVVLHSPRDYVYVKYGVNKSSIPLQLRIRNAKGEVDTYDIDTGHSLLEDAYSAWKTLSVLNDSITLASLIKNATTIIIQSEVGNASDEEIQQSKIKLKSLFEGKLALGRNGMKSYISPQSKPNYVYAFTSNNVGAITTTTVGGEYNPGQLYYLEPFVNQFFAAMGAPKQNFGYGESAGLDGGGAVEEYNKRYMSNVSHFKRLIAEFIKKCLNNILSSRNLLNVINNFSVNVYKAYKEEDQSIIQMQREKLQTLAEVVDFLGIEDQKKLREIKLVMVKKTLSDKDIIEAIDNAMKETKDEEAQAEENEEMLGDEGGSEESNDVISQIEGGGGGEDFEESEEFEETVEEPSDDEEMPELPPMTGMVDEEE